jgi:hypothetical protein
MIFIFIFSKEGFSRCSDGVPHLYCCPSSSVLVETGSGQATRMEQGARKKENRQAAHPLHGMAWHGMALHYIA